jgi:hypothetical protein
MKTPHGMAAVVAAAALLICGPAHEVAAKSSKVRIRADLVSTGADADASGKVEFRVQGGGKTRFKVEAEDLDAATYDIVVGGVVKGSLEVDAVKKGTEGETEFRNPAQKNKVLLDFDPRGQLVTIERAGTVFLQVVLPTDPPLKAKGHSGKSGGSGGNDPNAVDDDNGGHGGGADDPADHDANDDNGVDD